MARTPSRRRRALTFHPPTPSRRMAGMTCVVAMTLALAACEDQRSGNDDPPGDALATDSALARDLTLAGIPGASGAPVAFNDTAQIEPPRDEPSTIPARVAVTTRPRPVARQRRDVPNEPAPTPPSSEPASGAAVPRGATPDSATVVASSAGAGRSRGAIGAGSLLSFTTTTRICTSTNAPGDKIVATLDAPAAGTEGFTLPAGTTKAVLEMASVDRDAEGNPTGIVFRVRNLDDGASTYQATGEVTTTDSLRRTRAKNNPSADRRKVVGGAVLGAVLGQVLGKDTKATVIGAAAGGAAGAVTAARGARYEGCLPEGAKVTLRLAEPVVQ